MEMKENLCK